VPGDGGARRLPHAEGSVGLVIDRRAVLLALGLPVCICLRARAPLERARSVRVIGPPAFSLPPMCMSLIIRGAGTSLDGGHDQPRVRTANWAFACITPGSLGRENDTVDLARFGALDIVRINFASLNNTFPATQAMSLPYVLTLRSTCAGRSMGCGRLILKAFEKRGLVGLAIYDSGRAASTTICARSAEPSDLIGTEDQVPPSDMFVRLVRDLGANPTPLSYGEIFSALQTRLIDGAENNWTTFHTSRHFEVARFWSQSEHSFSPEALC